MITNQKGFSLVEIIAVLTILAIIIAIAVPKIISMDRAAEITALKVAIVELNAQELECWSKAKLDGHKVTDPDLFESCNHNIHGYEWTDLKPTGGLLTFKGSTVRVHRQLAAETKPAKWYLQ